MAYRVNGYQPQPSGNFDVRGEPPNEGSSGRAPLTTDPNMLILMRQCADIMLNVSAIIVQFTERQAAIELRLDTLEQRK